MGPREALEAINSLSLLPLGDPNKMYSVQLTEPEINSIYAATAFVESECSHLVRLAGGPPLIAVWWNHYGPTLDSLSKRLSPAVSATAAFDD